MLERYYIECDSPRYVKLRKHLIPFAEKFYANLTEDAFEELKEATNYFRSHYPSNYY
jgi:hypothetical protein